MVHCVCGQGGLELPPQRSLGVDRLQLRSYRETIRHATPAGANCPRRYVAKQKVWLLVNLSGKEPLNFLKWQQWCKPQVKRPTECKCVAGLSAADEVVPPDELYGEWQIILNLDPNCDLKQACRSLSQCDWARGRRRPLFGKMPAIL